MTQEHPHAEHPKARRFLEEHEALAVVALALIFVSILILGSIAS